MAASSTASTAPLVPLALLLLLLASYTCSVGAAEEVPAEEAVLTLDAGSFSEVVERHHFIVVEFYTPPPWCGHCKQLAPEHGKAASILSRRDPPIVLAMVDANDKKNKALGDTYDVQGFPSIKILRNQRGNVQDYNGPRDADGIVECISRSRSALRPSRSGPRRTWRARSVVGVFPEFGGGEYENFLAVVERRCERTTTSGTLWMPVFFREVIR